MKRLIKLNSALTKEEKKYLPKIQFLLQSIQEFEPNGHFDDFFNNINDSEDFEEELSSCISSMKNYIDELKDNFGENEEQEYSQLKIKLESILNKLNNIFMDLYKYSVI